MLPGRRQLFLYWRLGRDDLRAARLAMQALQRRWVGECPGLQAALMVRSDDHGGDEITCMETYGLDAAVDREGVGRGLQQRIEAEGHAVLAPWLRGPRHVEVFEALAP